MKLITAHEKDLGGGFLVRRSLPSLQKQSVGPFVFFDHMGPTIEHPGNGHDVRPHPHIGLATVTYLFEGALMHRDSLGTRQRIEPLALNWMTAGRGIVHSERKPEDLLGSEYAIHGLQLWAALPESFEEVEPQFTHIPADQIPEVSIGPIVVRVLVGSAFGAASPVKVFSETLYLDIGMPAGASLLVPNGVSERAIYSIDGHVDVAGQRIPKHTLAIYDDPNEKLIISADEPVRIVIIGGEPLGRRRAMWWNFVSSRPERIEQAKEDWRLQRMGRIEGDDEFIPLPP